MKELIISLPARRVEHKTFENAGRYISCPSEIGFDLFCQLIVTNMYGEFYPLGKFYYGAVYVLIIFVRQK
jgi:hypothetical protein